MIRETWHDLKELYGRGGIEVLTMAPAGVLVVRSVIQFDADIMTWVAQEHLDEAIWGRHLAQMQQKVADIQRFRTLFRRDLEIAFAALLSLNVLHSLFIQELSTWQLYLRQLLGLHPWLLQALDVAGSLALMIILPFLLRLLLMWLLQRLLRRAIAKLT